MGFLKFLWRVGIPIIGGVLELLCMLGIGLLWQQWSPAYTFTTLILTSLIVAAMALIVLLVLLIEGAIRAVHRVMLPIFMGILAISLTLIWVTFVVATADDVNITSVYFGSMKFYRIMLEVGIWLVGAALWLALIIIIQGLPRASLICLIVGGCAVGAALVVTFTYWLVQLLIYFFAHYYLIFFIVLGGALGLMYLTFLLIYCIVKRETLHYILKDNLDKYWRRSI